MLALGFTLGQLLLWALSGQNLLVTTMLWLFSMVKHWGWMRPQLGKLLGVPKGGVTALGFCETIFLRKGGSHLTQTHITEDGWIWGQVSPHAHGSIPTCVHAGLCTWSSHCWTNLSGIQREQCGVPIFL